MSRHDFVDDPIRAPATMRGIMKVWSVSFNDLIQMFDSAHDVPDVFLEPLNTVSFTCGRLAYANPRMIRLQRGQKSCSVLPSAIE
jgi:hypothetical protein